MQSWATIAGGAAALLTCLIMGRIGLRAVIGSLAPLFIVINVLLILAGYVFLPRDLRITSGLVGTMLLGLQLVLEERVPRPQPRGG